MNFYSKGNDVITIVQEDFTGRKLQRFRANLNDEDEIARLFQSVIDKYGLNLKITKEVSKKGGSWLDVDEEFSW